MQINNSYVKSTRHSRFMPLFQNNKMTPKLRNKVEMKQSNYLSGQLRIVA